MSELDHAELDHAELNHDSTDLLQHPDLWRAGQLTRAPEAYPSGFAPLDRHLPGGGWPKAGLGEFLLNTTGVGELRLLAPLLKQLSREQDRWLAWINPPFIPYAPALTALGIDINKILLVHPRNPQDALWALERASRSGSCSLALAWLDEKSLTFSDTRRLQLAARQGGTFTCLFRPEQARQASSMAELRLQLAPGDQGEVEVAICKRRGGWPVSGFKVRVSQERDPREIREQLSLWRSLRAGRRSQAEDAVDTISSVELVHLNTASQAPRVTH